MLTCIDSKLKISFPFVDFNTCRYLTAIFQNDKSRKTCKIGSPDKLLSKIWNTTKCYRPGLAKKRIRKIL